MASLTGAPAPPPVVKRTSSGPRVVKQPAVVPAAPQPYTVETIRAQKRGSEVVQDDGKKNPGSKDPSKQDDPSTDEVKK
jgi:hypothetical protein